MPPAAQVTDVSGSKDRPPWPGTAEWFRMKDPGLVATKRSVRAAVVVSGIFAIAHVAFADYQVSLFASFGSFALLLLVDFGGRPRTRLVSYLALFATGCVFVTVGTVASTDKVAAVASMAVVGFLVLFAGILSPQAATAATAALLTFVLPVAVAAPVGEIGPRLVGFALAGAASIPACLLVWPVHWHDALRRRLATTLSAEGRLVAAHARGSRDRVAKEAVDAELADLRAAFARTPYPPTGASAGAVGLAKLVGRSEWVAENAVVKESAAADLDLAPVRTILGGAAGTLELSARLVGQEPGDDDGVSLDEQVRASAHRLDALVHEELEAEVARMLTSVGLETGREADGPTRSGAAERDGGVESLLDPTFHARALAVATEMVADAALEASGSEPAGDLAPLEESDRSGHPLWSRIASHLSLESVWFRNAVRGAAGLALAVAVAEVTNVQHAFWVVLGTLAVLRSSALATGSTALRAIGGTAVGFVIGSALLVGIGASSAALWVVLPIAVLVAGTAPAMISFAAGQAGFTVTVVVLFNIIQPSGWRVGLTRIEDVSIGCAVSIVVGLLFWPRGATAALGRALAEAFVAHSGYLSDAVSQVVSSDREVDLRAAYRESQRTYLRADDAFRQFLSERGAKVIPIDTVTRLVTGANRIRLGAFTLASLPPLRLPAGSTELESTTVAAAVLRDAYASSHRWYEGFAEMLAGRRDALDRRPHPDDPTVHHVLAEALEDARRRRRPDRVRAVLRMLWAEDLLEHQREVQNDLAAAAELFARRSRRAHLV